MTNQKQDLIEAMARHYRKPPVERFLSEVTASVVACCVILRDYGPKDAEFVVPRYIDVLVETVHQRPEHKQNESFTVALAFLVLGLLADHQMRFAERVAHCQKAVTYARTTEIQALLVTCLTHLGETLLNNRQLEKSLQTYAKAEGYSKRMGGFWHSKVLSEKARVYARQGKSQEARQCLDEAYAIFIEDKDSPTYIEDHGRFVIILHDGSCSLALGKYEEEQGNSDRAFEYYQDAANKLAQIEQQLPRIKAVPQPPIRVDIFIKRALAAAKVGKLEEFETYLRESFKGTTIGESGKLQREAKEAWKVAKKQWPDEDRVLELAETLFGGRN